MCLLLAIAQGLLRDLCRLQRRCATLYTYHTGSKYLTTLIIGKVPRTLEYISVRPNNSYKIFQYLEPVRYSMRLSYILWCFRTLLDQVRASVNVVRDV